MQHIARHGILVARMADAQPDPRIGLAQMGMDRAQAVVPGMAAALLDARLAGARSSSSWKTVISSTPSFQKSAAARTDWPERFMKVSGFSSATFSVPSRPSLTSP